MRGDIVKEILRAMLFTGRLQHIESDTGGAGPEPQPGPCHRLRAASEFVSPPTAAGGLGIAPRTRLEGVLAGLMAGRSPVPAHNCVLSRSGAASHPKGRSGGRRSR